MTLDNYQKCKIYHMFNIDIEIWLIQIYVKKFYFEHKMLPNKDDFISKFELEILVKSEEYLLLHHNRYWYI